MNEPIDTNSTLSTPALESFRFNGKRLTHFFTFISHAVQGGSQEVSVLQPGILAKLDDLKQRLNSGKFSDDVNKADLIREQMIGIEQDLLDLGDKLEERADTLGEFVSGLNLGLEWMPVLMVTITETYMLDVLAYAASTDPTLMQKSEISATYPEIANHSSLEELLESMRYRWARNWINDGGPQYWIQRLTKMGAREYRSELADEMETLWGIRHLLIHTTGIATPDFVHRHPNFVVAVGEKVQMKLSHIKNWTKSIYHFVEVTDAYFARRCKLKSEE